MGISYTCMDDDEYSIINYPNGKTITYGPGMNCYCCASPNKRKLPSITSEQYLEVMHLTPDINGNILEIVQGPQLYKPADPYCVISGVKQKIRLRIDEYLVKKDVNGQISIENGPTLYCPIPYEELSKVKKKVNLTATQYIIVTTQTTGDRRVVRGALLYSPQPMEQISGPHEMIILNRTDYIYVTHTDSGLIDIVEGATIFCPGAYDVVSDIRQKIVLKNDEYVKIMDSNTGVIRVVPGPSTIVLRQFEKIVNKITKAHEVNDMNAVYIFDSNKGLYDLIIEHGMYIPEPTIDVIETRKKILLEQNEAMVIIDKNGRYVIMRGNDNTSAFFLPPYCTVLEQDWSTDIGKHHGKISRFDLRPQYMDFEFQIRTCDNVEIFLKLNFYWQIVNIEKMISTTHNAPQDVCLHAQSEILSEISRINMKEFMESFNEVVHKALLGDGKDEFYDARGVKLIRGEITGRRCKDPDTEKNFQEIIKKKTDRIKNLESTCGVNEVKMEEIRGNIEQEKLIGELVTVKNSYLRSEASKSGESHGAKISNFLEHLPSDLSIDQKLAIYFDQQNTDRVKDVTSNKNLTLYVSQKDLDIKMVNLNYGDKKPNLLLDQL